jgi:hypothetical protein
MLDAAVATVSKYLVEWYEMNKGENMELTEVTS